MLVANIDPAATIPTQLDEAPLVSATAPTLIEETLMVETAINEGPTVGVEKSTPDLPLPLPPPSKKPRVSPSSAVTAEDDASKISGTTQLFVPPTPEDLLSVNNVHKYLVKNFAPHQVKCLDVKYQCSNVRDGVVFHADPNVHMRRYELDAVWGILLGVDKNSNTMSMDNHLVAHAHAIYQLPVNPHDVEGGAEGTERIEPDNLVHLQLKTWFDLHYIKPGDLVITQNVATADRVRRAFGVDNGHRAICILDGQVMVLALQPKGSPLRRVSATFWRCWVDKTHLLGRDAESGQQADAGASGQTLDEKMEAVKAAMTGFGPRVMRAYRAVFSEQSFGSAPNV